MILGERPEARLLHVHFAKTIQSVVVKHGSDASAPGRWHHVERLQNTVVQRDHSDGLVGLERNIRLPIWIGECGDPVRANRVRGELIDVCWEDVLEARDRRSARDPKTQLGVLSIIVACWHMLTTGEIYRDVGGDYYTRLDPDKQARRLVAQLERLGHTVTLQEAAA
jgi:hypothetical protein